MPLDHDWALIFFWLGAQVLPRWGQTTEAEFWAMLGDEPRVLNSQQQTELLRLRHDIRRSVERK